jgi:hypothetical protein
MIAALVIAALLFGRVEEQGRVNGTVVSIRGNILQMRPRLRPKLTRVSFSNATEILAYRRVTKDFLQVGMRVSMGGIFSEKEGFSPFFIEAATEPLGRLKNKSEGVKPEPGGNGWANALGTIKRLDSFVFTDDNGKEYTPKFDRMRGYWQLFRGDRNSLLIGTSLEAMGPIAPDGVIQASVIIPDPSHAASGTMFGQILAFDGKTLKVRPRYTQDTIEVQLTKNCTFQRELKIDPNSIKIGTSVTVWAQRGKKNDGQENELHPLALLLGDGRYPAATSGDGAAPFWTGRLTTLDPVRLTLTDGTQLEVIVPAQLAIARLISIKPTDLKPGAQAMLVLERADGDHFTTTHLILDASPWVGYGG